MLRQLCTSTMKLMSRQLICLESPLKLSVPSYYHSRLKMEEKNHGQEISEMQPLEKEPPLRRADKPSTILTELHRTYSNIARQPESSGILK
jgi:hypothetical protein